MNLQSPLDTNGSGREQCNLTGHLYIYWVTRTPYCFTERCFYWYKCFAFSFHVSFYSISILLWLNLLMFDITSITSRLSVPFVRYYRCYVYKFSGNTFVFTTLSPAFIILINNKNNYNYKENKLQETVWFFINFIFIIFMPNKILLFFVLTFNSHT